jgi:hypothetical protein
MVDLVARIYPPGFNTVTTATVVKPAAEYWGDLQPLLKINGVWSRYDINTSLIQGCGTAYSVGIHNVGTTTATIKMRRTILMNTNPIGKTSAISPFVPGTACYLAPKVPAEIWSNNQPISLVIDPLNANVGKASNVIGSGLSIGLVVGTYAAGETTALVKLTYPGNPGTDPAFTGGFNQAFPADLRTYTMPPGSVSWAGGAAIWMGHDDIPTAVAAATGYGKTFLGYSRFPFTSDPVDPTTFQVSLRGDLYKDPVVNGVVLERVGAMAVVTAVDYNPSFTDPDSVEGHHPSIGNYSSYRGGSLEFDVPDPTLDPVTYIIHIYHMYYYGYKGEQSVPDISCPFPYDQLPTALAGKVPAGRSIVWRANAGTMIPYLVATSKPSFCTHTKKLWRPSSYSLKTNKMVSNEPYGARRTREVLQAPSAGSSMTDLFLSGIAQGQNYGSTNILRRWGSPSIFRVHGNGTVYSSVNPARCTVITQNYDGTTTTHAVISMPMIHNAGTYRFFYGEASCAAWKNTDDAKTITALFEVQDSGGVWRSGPGYTGYPVYNVLTNQGSVAWPWLVAAVRPPWGTTLFPELKGATVDEVSGFPSPITSANESGGLSYAIALSGLDYNVTVTSTLEMNAAATTNATELIDAVGGQQIRLDDPTTGLHAKTLGTVSGFHALEFNDYGEPITSFSTGVWKFKLRNSDLLAKTFRLTHRWDVSRGESKSYPGASYNFTRTLDIVIPPT